MKGAFLLVFLAVSVASATAKAWFDQFPKFNPSEIEIIWAASINNNWPTAPWVYEVFPQKFSESMISNLLAITSFTEHDKTDESGLKYANKSQNRNLVIVPENGWVRFWDQEPELPQKKVVEGVLDTAQVQQRALDILSRLGISSSQLATKTNGNFLAYEEERTTTHFDKTKRKRITEVYSRGVFFDRQVDGIPFAGIGMAGGFSVRFGLQGKLAWLELVWRNVKRYEQYTMPMPEQITKMIKEGATYATHGTTVNLNGIKKLTITEVTPLYTCGGGEESQSFVYPFLKIQATAETAETNNASVQLYCPVAK